jgi:hypothetical protein
MRSGERESKKIDASIKAEKKKAEKASLQLIRQIHTSPNDVP